jgi:riboflavin kinase/FMN adenylyltransferase
LRLFRGLPSVADVPLALTVGNFDGVHRGHQAMLRRVLEAADDLRVTSAALTFHPHPREYFSPETAPPRLSTLREKIEQIGALGIERLYVARFDRALASLSPEDFIERVLLQSLGTRWILVGDDFRFGKARAGGLAELRAASRHARFSVEAMGTVDVDGERVSSTAVRQALAAGELGHAARLLGRPYAIAGRVAHGEKLGRNLGFPTANIALYRRPPVSGVFAARVLGIGSTPRPAAVSIGVRPTVTQRGQPLLEAYLLDFDGDLYGRRISVELLRKLRDEERFDSVERLAAQIRSDVVDARAYFAERPAATAS